MRNDKKSTEMFMIAISTSALLSGGCMQCEFMQIDKKANEPWFAGATKWVTITCASVFGFIMLLVAFHRVDLQQIMDNFARLGGGG